MIVRLFNIGGGYSVLHVISIYGISPTVRLNSGTVVLILDDRDMKKIGASRGRNPNNHSERKAGMPTQQTLEINEDNITNTITSVAKDNLVIEYEENTPPRHSSNKIIQVNKDNKESGGNQPYQQNRIYHSDGHVPALMSDMSCGTHAIQTEETIKNIRRLTEIECERLQGYPNNWTEYGIYEKQVWINKKLGTFEIVFEKHKVPSTQRYKMLGNAVSVCCPKIIAERLLKIEP